MGYTYNVLASMLIPLIVVLAIADDVHIMQHWDEERRHKSAEASFKATVAHLAAPLFGASATTALGMAVARHQQRRRGPIVRRRRGGRDHGRLHDLAGVRADDPEPDEAGAARSRPTRDTWCSRCGGSRRSRRAVPRAVLAVAGALALIAVAWDPEPARRHQPHQLLQRRTTRSGSRPA